MDTIKDKAARAKIECGEGECSGIRIQDPCLDMEDT